MGGACARQLLDGGHLGRSCRFKRPGRPCGGYSDQDLNLLNRGPFAGQLIGRLHAVQRADHWFGRIGSCLQGPRHDRAAAHQRRWRALGCLGMRADVPKRADR